MKATRKRFGFISSQKLFLGRMIEKFFSITGIECVLLRIEKMKINTQIPEGFELRFLTEEEIENYSKDPENDLGDLMVGRIASGKDFCYAALSDNKLAAYGWYSLEDIEGLHNFGIPISFPKNFSYMYKGFTHPEFRGKRLHSLLMGNALKELNQSHGIDALISTVTWTNFASLTSCKKLGYEFLGRIWTVREGQQILSKPSRLKTLNVLISPDVKPHIAECQLDNSKEAEKPKAKSHA